MNTRLGKSFGLAFVVAVGILAVMFALGTFNAQKAGADTGADAVLTRDNESANSRSWLSAQQPGGQRRSRVIDRGGGGQRWGLGVW